ncbi:uncharacterized protein [Palaemon carinicauda]|uniref:uncharacterized protein isoform X2 n=1 Tax=Palaemon carinicauda TaxID=392227 RepID=UPI0035B60062
MAGGVLTQLRCLFWRHYLQYLRQWPWLLSIILVAALPFALLAGLKSTVPPQLQSACYFKPRIVSSQQPLAILQSYVCNLNNECQQKANDDLLDSYPGATVNTLLNSTGKSQSDGTLAQFASLPSSIGRLANLTHVISSPNLTALMENGLRVADVIRSPADMKVILTSRFGFEAEVVDAILESRLDMSRVMSLVGYRDIKTVICSPDQLGQFLVAPTSDDVATISTSLCRINSSEIANISRVFVSSLDPSNLFNKVSDVLKAIGGYEAESLVQEVGGLLASLGRLEALAPLATMLNALDVATQPLISAMSTLDEAGWNAESLTSLVNWAEEFFKPTELDGSREVQMLLAPKAMISLSSEKLISDPYMDLLTKGVQAINKTESQLMGITKAIEDIPELHTAVVLTTSLLPTLLAPGPLNFTSIGEALAVASDRMMPDARLDFERILPLAHASLHLATKALNVTKSASLWFRDVPSSVALHVLQAFANVTLTKTLVQENQLVEWTCRETNWPNMSLAEWETFEKHLCGDEYNVGKLREIESLIMPLTDPTALQELLESFSTSTAQIVVKELEMTVTVLHKILYTLLGREAERRKRSVVGTVGDYLGEIPAGDSEAIQGIERGFTDTKNLLRTVTRICVTLAQSSLAELERENALHSDVISQDLVVLLRGQPVVVLSDVVASILDTALQILHVVKSPWQLQDLRFSDHLSKILFQVIPSNVYDGVLSVMEMLESPTIEVPGPVPQLLGLLSAVNDIILRIQSRSSLQEWFEEELPYTYSLFQKSLDVVPRILAIPYLWTLNGVPEDAYALLVNETHDWMMYPCGPITLTKFYPSSDVYNLPESWADLEDIKESVKRYEEFLCENGTRISQEVSTFDPKLSQSMRDLVENMVPGRINVSDSMHLAKNVFSALIQVDPKFVDETTHVAFAFMEEMRKSFSAPSLNESQIYSVMAGTVEGTLRWFDKFPSTQSLYSQIQFFMYHAEATGRAIIELLNGPPSLIKFVGLPEDSLPVVLLQKDPKGTADFLLQELTEFIVSSVTGGLPMDWMVVGNSTCERSANRSSLVALACYLSTHPEPPNLQSPLAGTLVNALTSFQQGNLAVPRVQLKDLVSTGEQLINTVARFDPENITEFASLRQLWLAIVNESRAFYEGLEKLQQNWLFMTLDSAVSQNEPLLEVLTDVEVIVSWLKDQIPQNIETMLSNLPPSVKQFHDILNSSWIDLLDGLHFNFYSNTAALLNTSLADVCLQNSSLREPGGDSTRFKDAVNETCYVLSSFSTQDLNEWLPYDQLIKDMTNSSRTFSSKDTFSYVKDTVSSLRNLVEEALDVISSNSEGADLSTNTLPLPSYLQKEQWMELGRRISSRGYNTTFSESLDVSEVFLGWALGENIVMKSHMLRMITLHQTVLKRLLAPNFLGMLEDAPTLRNITETITSYFPRALKDLAGMISQRPEEVGKLIEIWQANVTAGNVDWNNVCQMDLKIMGHNFQETITRLCEISSSDVVRDIGSFFKVDLFQDPFTAGIRETLENNLKDWFELQEQLLTGTFLQKFSDPGVYLGLEMWRAVPDVVFNVSSDTMWSNSTMILARLLEPIVLFSQTPGGEATKEFLIKLDQTLRSVRLTLALAQGGDIWKALRGAYVDKPVVNEFFDVIQVLPQFLLEYMDFFGNYSLISQAMFFRSDTFCNFHLFLLDGNREYLANKSSVVLFDVLEFFCNHQHMSLILQQLVPNSPAIIANITMELDAAMLANLLDYVAWDLLYIVEGNFYEGPLQVPTWAEEPEWRRVFERFQTFLALPPKEFIILAAGLSLDTVRSTLGDQYIVPAVSAAYQVSKSLTSNINETTGEIDFDGMFQAWPKLDALQKKVVSIAPNLVAIALWFPESKAYYYLITGSNPHDVYYHMCEEGVDEWLIQPYLTAGQWETVHSLLCPSEPLTPYDFSGLTNSSEIMDGMTIDWLKIGLALENMIVKLPTLSFSVVKRAMENDYIKNFQELTPNQRIIRGLLSGTWLLQQGLFGTSAEERHSMATFFIQTIAALHPITTHDENLFRRLADLTSFKELLKEYADVMENINNGTSFLRHRYQVSLSPGLVPEWPVENASVGYQNAMSNILHYELLRDLKVTLLNLTTVLFSEGDSTVPPLSAEEIMANITTNMLLSLPELFQTVESPTCESFSGMQWKTTFQYTSKSFQVVSKHVGLWHSYVNFICQLPGLNIDDIFKKSEAFGLRTDIQGILNGDFLGDESLDCPFTFNQLQVLQNQVSSVINDYVSNETAGAELMSCLEMTASSATGSRFRGLISVAGGLLGIVSGSRDEILAGLLKAVETIPDASVSLRSLASRITVLVPVRQILNENFEEDFEGLPDVITILKNDFLLVDVNRIYNVDNVTLTKHLTSRKEMSKVFQERTKSVSVVRKRQISPLDLLYEVISSVGPNVFAEKLLAGVNSTYLDEEIDRLRMEGLLTSERLLPIMDSMNDAVATLSKLGELEAVVDLSKIITGEVDPVSFLSGAVQLMQIKLWNDLALSFLQIVNTSIPLISGSELEEDLIQVVEGINSLQNAINLAVLDFTIPTTSLIFNWTDMETYLKNSLQMDPSVIDALSGTELNIMEVLSLQDVTLEEVICGGRKMENIVSLPARTNVTLADVSSSLCNASDAEGLVSVFLQHLDIGPLIATLTRFGINTTLSSYGMTLNQVINDIILLEQSASTIPELVDTMKVIWGGLRSSEYSQAQELKESPLEEFSSPSFLQRAGKFLCGESLRLVPDSMGLLSMAAKKEATLASRGGNLGFCETIEKEIKALPGGQILLYFIKPLIQGKIFYTPQNPITEEIIRQANETFKTADVQRQAMHSLEELAHKLTSSEGQSDLLRLENAFKTPWLKEMMLKMFPKDKYTVFSEDIIELAPRLHELGNLTQELTEALSLGVKLMSCLNFHRFIAVDNEEEMLVRAEEAVNVNEFLAGIVFEGVDGAGGSDSPLPREIAYSIRVDYEKTPTTFILGPKMWRPGPYTNMVVQMKYHQGFLLLQQMIDQAIIELHYNKSKMQKLKTLKFSGKRFSTNLQNVGSRRRPKRAVAVPSGFNLSQSEEAEMILNVPVYTKQEPYPCYEKDEFMAMVNDSPVISLILSFVAFTLLIVFIIQHLVQERKSRNKQLQEVMGLKVWLDHFVWFLFASALLLLVLLMLSLITKFGGIQPKVNFWVFFIFLYCYGISLVSMCYLVSCTVKGPVMAVFIGVMSLLVFNVPFITVSVLHVNVPLFGIILSCLLPPSAFGFGFRIICQYELLGIGLGYENIWMPPLKGTELTLGLTMVMLIADAVLFYILALICTALANGPFQYICTKGTSEMTSLPDWQGYGTYKRGNDFTFNIFQAVCCNCDHGNKVSPPAKESSESKTPKNKPNIQVLDVDPGLKQSLQKGLSILGLRRIFHQRGRSKVAVQNLNLELYEGQILALLGHNGAGKTTIISAITREIETTSGSIQVYGHDIRTSWNKARSFIGLCPQESVLFPLMTVRETLLYFTILKGTPHERADEEVNTVMVDMGLFNHRQYIGRQLSEGMRRRLCLALAFVGRSKLIILDEPTSGVDPAARTAMWEVISSNRGGRTILFTTHHLDEAETLADRVAILHQGQLLCVGSPLALKSEYGSGYSITLSNRKDLTKSDIEQIQEKIFSKDQGIGFSEVGFGKQNTDGVWKLITKYVSNAKLLEAINGERTYCLPLTNTKGEENRISEMFGELESRLEELGFSSLEVRPTNLEDVVIALDAINNLDSGIASPSRTAPMMHHTEMEEKVKGAYNFKPSQTLDGAGLLFQRLAAVLYKRLMSHGRRWDFYMQMFILPLIFVILAMLGSIIRPMFEESKPLSLKPELYDPSVAYIRTMNQSMIGLATEVTGGGEWQTCPSTSGKASEGGLNCNSSILVEDSKCLCRDNMCWMNVTDQSSLSDWLIGTKGKYLQRRFSGLTLGTAGTNGEGGSQAVVWYDNSVYHALPAYLSLFNNARLKRLVGKDFNISTVNHPIKFTKNSLSSMTVEQHVADLGIGLLILVSLTVVTSATGGYVVAERVRGERTVLYVAGLSRNLYWTAHMIWDILVITLNLLLMAGVLLVFNQQQFIYRENLAAFIFLAFLYGLSLLPLFYLVEGFFKSEASAVLVFFSTVFATGLITSLIVVTCQFYTWVATLQEMEGVLKYLFLVFPPFAFAFGIKDLSINYAKTAILARFDIDIYETPFSWDTKLQGGLGLHFLSLAIWAVLGTTILHTWRKCLGPLPQPAGSSRSLAGAEEDRDVAAERIKIQCGGASLYDTVLRIVGLGKDFTSPPSVAVSNLFLALRGGECFSLLGLNGAGKTTTFRCVTGELRPSRGEILINGQLLEKALAQPHPMMGYCPQSEALDPNLTPREALTVMALVRGFPKAEVSQVLRKALVQMGLLQDHNTYISQLSGGIKRKLSTAMALLGNPALVLLDEPTTGLDPSSRRGIWSAIRSVTQDGRTVLMTSHSMDEVNVLSHRMAIMVNGYFVCMGSPHYLKNKLGDKYSVRIKTNAIEDIAVIVEYLRTQWTDIMLKEQHHLTLVMEVSRKLPLQLIFDSLNRARELGITEYDVSQTTLNEVFRLLTSHQDDGQLPPAPVRNESEQPGLPIHIQDLPPEAVVTKTPEHTFHRTNTPFSPVRIPSTVDAGHTLPAVESDRPHNERSSFYDNVGGDDQSEIYATIAKHRAVRPSPDIESFKSETGSSDESPEEEWTQL